MTRVKSLIAAAALTFVLAVAAGGQAPPCTPGETLTPPCSSALATAPGETLTPPGAETVEIVSLVEFALNALLLF